MSKTQLSERDIKRFFQVYMSLLFYANRRLRILEGLSSVADLRELTHEFIASVAEPLHDNPDIIEDFVRENPAGLGSDDLELARSWVDAASSEFIVLKHLSRYTVFLDPSGAGKAYGVLGLSDALQDTFPHLPVVMRTVLLPFEGKIVCNGLFHVYRVFLGPGYRRSMEDAYRDAKARFGVITSLPFAAEERPDADLDRLRALLRSERTRAEHWDEIEELIGKDRSLLVEYHQRMGSFHARHHRKALKDAGVMGGWYAVVEGAVVAGADSKERVEQTVERLVPEDRRDLVHLYQAKGR